MTSLKNVVLACGLLVAVAGTAGAQDFRWRGFVPNGGTVEVRGINGAIRAEPSTQREVEVTAEKRGRRSDPASVGIEVSEQADGVVICAVYPTRDGSSSGCNERGGGRNGRIENNDVQVTFTVRVPAGVTFVGRTVNGDVEAMRMEAPLNLATVNGSVRFSTSESGRASTVNGSVTGELGRADWNDSLNVNTVNGSITLTLPADVNSTVRASTVHGEILTNFPLTLSGRSSRRNISGTIGAGGRELSLHTVNGDITVQRN